MTLITNPKNPGHSVIAGGSSRALIEVGESVTMNQQSTLAIKNCNVVMLYQLNKVQRPNPAPLGPPGGIIPVFQRRGSQEVKEAAYLGKVLVNSCYQWPTEGSGAQELRKVLKVLSLA